MDSRAEKKALEAYPDIKEGEFDDMDAETWVKQTNPHCRRGFVKGYRQAEKDTIEKAARWIEEYILSWVDSEPSYEDYPTTLTLLKGWMDRFEEDMKDE